MENTELIESLKNKLRAFFDKKGGEEIEIGNKPKILNGSVNFNNLLKFEYDGLEYPLPQTQLFSLENHYIKSQFGVYTFSEVFEYSENGDPHQKLICEFILKGDERMMSIVNHELINSLGFSIPMTLTHQDILRKYSVNKLDDNIRTRINYNLGNVVTIKNFPNEEVSNWFVKLVDNEYLYKETILNGHQTIKYLQLINDKEAFYYNFQTYNNNQVRETLMGNFDTGRIYDEVTGIYNLELEERFLGQIDLVQLSKSFKSND